MISNGATKTMNLHAKRIGACHKFERNPTLLNDESTSLICLGRG